MHVVLEMKLEQARETSDLQATEEALKNDMF